MTVQYNDYAICDFQENPDVRILQYAPGPLDTDMMGELQNSPQDIVSTMAKEMKEQGALLSVEQTTLKLCEILEKSDFKSGAHIDYFDP